MRCARGLNWANRPAALAACVVALWAFAGVALAQSTQAFGVRTAYAQLVDGVYLLNARLHLPLNERIRGAINDGVPLTLELEIEVVTVAVHLSHIYRKLGVINRTQAVRKAMELGLAPDNH